MNSPYEAREQTEVKHEVLSRYLSAFVPIVGNWASDIIYIDCLAGPWKSADPNCSDTSFGRAVAILRSTRGVLKDRGKSPKMHCLFIERDPDAFRKLEDYCKSVQDLDVVAENWDFTSHLDDIVRFARQGSKPFPFEFVDPKGWEAIQTGLIAPILQMFPGEVLITLMTSWITRFISDESKGFERLLGPDLDRIQQLAGEEQEDEVVRCYATSVRDVGRYEYVCTLPVMKADQDAFHFYMIYGTRHPKGVDVFKKTEKYVVPFMHETRARAQERKRLQQTGQHGLFGADTQYRERKFTRFRERNLELARSRLQDLLTTSGHVKYDDAWAMAMQYSGVMETDLQDWMREWQSAKLLAFSDLGPRQKLPRREHRQYLIWRG
jgi:three-Cys-motif partner protein